LLAKIRDSVTDFGITVTPRWRCHRMITWRVYEWQRGLRIWCRRAQNICEAHAEGAGDKRLTWMDERLTSLPRHRPTCQGYLPEYTTQTVMGWRAQPPRWEVFISHLSRALWHFLGNLADDRILETRGKLSVDVSQRGCSRGMKSGR